MAVGFPVPESPGTFGLQIPLAAMLDMAEILYDVNLEDENGNNSGIYFEGISYTLYPTTYSDDRSTIQWHLQRKTNVEGNHAFAANHSPDPTLTRILDLKTLSNATAILGYCGEVVIQLGTESRRSQYEKFRHALADIENPPPEAYLSNLSGGLSILGWISGGLAASFRPRKGLRDAREDLKERLYTTVLDSAEKQQVILFDTGKDQQRAWMVPQLCVILDLFNFWAFKKKFEDIHYAEALPNGAAAAKKVLEDKAYANRPVIPRVVESDPPGMSVGSMVKYIYGQMRRRMLQNSGSDEGAKGTIRMGKSGMVGWDWLELMYDEAHESLDRRNILNFPIPCWMPFTKILPVFLGQNMGQLITPAYGNQLCRHWNPIPGGYENNYLVASTACIKELASYYGHDEPWFFFDNLVWDYRDESIFQPCPNTCIEKPRTCRKRPQVLVQKKNKLKRKQQTAEDERLPQVPGNGAVVFATARKDEALLGG
jgi:hypothetical protein